VTVEPSRPLQKPQGAGHPGPRRTTKNSVSSVIHPLPDTLLIAMKCHVISWCEFFTAEWLTAIGTVATAIIAVLLALYGEQVKRWKWHPNLKLRARVRRPDADKVSRVARLESGHRIPLGESWYFRLAVFNDGNETAENVQVFLARVERKHGHKLERVERFTPMNLRWTNTDDEVTSRDRVTRPTLLVETPPVFCDLLHISDPTTKRSQGEDLTGVVQEDGVLALDVQVATYSKGHLLEPGKYLLHLTVAASNSPSVHYVMEVSYSGKWSPDEEAMFGEFKMKRPERVKRGPQEEN
jgi:hypothetical protein